MRHDKKSLRRDGRAGFTLLEVQVAIIVLLVVLLTIGGHYRIYNQMLDGTVTDKPATGYFDLYGERGFLITTTNGKDAAPPVCDITVQSVNWGGSYPRAYVRVQQSNP